MFPTGASFRGSTVTFLCLRRGVSKPRVFRQQKMPFSLPTQRCFPEFSHPQQESRLFSAYAEVFPAEAPPPEGQISFSLPTQRCFFLSPVAKVSGSLFSAYAEVFHRNGGKDMDNKTFLCLRRGVSLNGDVLSCHDHFSLPTQRCFPASDPTQDIFKLFSAYAEVFPRYSGESAQNFRFSLPTQRCFQP